MANVAKIKNVSSGEFILTLDMVTRGKTYTLNPNSEVGVTEDELNYLTVECPNAFKNGFLKAIALNETVEVPVTENEYDDKAIKELLSSPTNSIKKKLKTITAGHVLKEILHEAQEQNKSNAVIEAIEDRIKEISDSLVI